LRGAPSKPCKMENKKGQIMKPKRIEKIPQDDLFRSRLDNILNSRHELVKLADSMSWDFLESKVAPFYSPEGRPGIPVRLMVGLHILKQVYNLSDEAVCERWVENPYFQYFCGETYFQHDFPIERSSMTHFRHRVGEDFCISLLQESLHTAHKLGAIETKQMERVIVDTTVQSKAVTFPTDSKLRYKAIVALAKLAKKNNIVLRQSYVRVGKSAAVASGRYRHAKQMKRAKKVEKKLNTYLGRMIRDIERKIAGEDSLRIIFKESLEKATKIHSQQKTDTDKIYSWHAPEVECIAKGKAHKPYEFGCKVSITTNVNPAPAGHFVLHAKAFHGRPYDGHTLTPVLAEMKVQTGIEFERAYVDKGYRGHQHPHKLRVFISGQKRGITATIKRELRRRSTVEPLIGHLKNEGRLGRNYLYGVAGDKINAIMVSAGYNFKLILRWLRFLFSFVLAYLISSLKPCLVQKQNVFS
jgi:IS5 family transposase